MDSAQVILSLVDPYKAKKSIRCLIEDIGKGAYTLPSCGCVKVSRENIKEAWKPRR